MFRKTVPHIQNPQIFFFFVYFTATCKKMVNHMCLSGFYVLCINKITIYTYDRRDKLTRKKTGTTCPKIRGEKAPRNSHRRGCRRVRGRVHRGSLPLRTGREPSPICHGDSDCQSHPGTRKSGIMNDLNLFHFDKIEERR
jgi:hypothetical protein